MSPKTPKIDPPAPPSIPPPDELIYGVWFERDGNGYTQHVIQAPRSVLMSWTAKSYLPDIRMIVMSRLLMTLEQIFDALPLR